MVAYSLTAETFAEYGIGMVFSLVRLFARCRLGGLRGLRLDDAFAVAAMIFWTMQTAIIYLLELHGNNIGLDAKSAMLVPEDKVPNLILGSKLAFMNWIWYLCYIWSLKGVLLCLYYKLMHGTWHCNLVKGAVGFCSLTWLVCLLTHICICTPVHRNWQIKPYPGDNCTLRGPLYIVMAVLNVLSDIVIIVLPIPVFTKLQMPLQRKLILVVMFSSGIFIMICTILRACYSLGHITDLPIALGWADRECFVAAIVVSLPGIKPLLRNSRWLGSSNRKDFKNQYYSPGSHSCGFKTSRRTITSILSHRHGSSGRNFKLDSVIPITRKGRRLSSGDSEEYVLKGAKNPSTSARPAPRNNEDEEPFAIHVMTEYSLHSERGLAGNPHWSPGV